MTMKKTTSLILLSCITTLVACQNISQQYNGQTGFQVIQKTASTATLSYTLANNDRNENREARKLQNACQQTLGTQKTYQIKILDTQEIARSIAPETVPESIALGKSTTFGFSNTPNINNNIESYATFQVDETRPSTLKIVRFTCS